MLGDAGRLLGASVGELVPPDAQAHLLAAQRELLLAITVTLEHNLRRGDGDDDTEERRERNRPRRVELD